MEGKAASPNPAWGVLVIGLGWGKLLAHAVAKRDDARVLAVADVDGVKAERCGKELEADAFTDYRAAINQPGLNTALIALPPELHKESAIACIEQGLHVYLEKPAGRQDRPEEVLEIAELARAAGVRFMPGFSQRFAPYAQAALDTVRSGALGTVLSVDILRQSHFGPEWTEAPGWGCTTTTSATCWQGRFLTRSPPSLPPSATTAKG